MTNLITTHVRIANLNCKSCVQLCTLKFKQLAGVNEVTIDLKTGATTIISETELAIEHLQSALADTNYQVLPVQDTMTA